MSDVLKSKRFVVRKSLVGKNQVIEFSFNIFSNSNSNFSSLVIILYFRALVRIELTTSLLVYLQEVRELKLTVHSYYLQSLNVSNNDFLLVTAYYSNSFPRSAVGILFVAV